MKTFFAFLTILVVGVTLLINKHFEVGFSVVCASVVYLFGALVNPEQPYSKNSNSTNTGYMSHQQFYASKANANKKREYTGRAPVALMAKYEQYQAMEQSKPKDSKNNWYNDDRKENRFSDNDDIADMFNTSHSTGLRFNPATGLLITGGVTDIGGNLFGTDNSAISHESSCDSFSDSGFTDDSFSSFDDSSSFDMDSFSSFDDF